MNRQAIFPVIYMKFCLRLQLICNGAEKKQNFASCSTEGILICQSYDTIFIQRQSFCLKMFAVTQWWMCKSIKTYFCLVFDKNGNTLFITIMRGWETFPMLFHSYQVHSMVSILLTPRQCLTNVSWSYFHNNLTLLVE